MAWRTPSGLLFPRAASGCNVAASRCQVGGPGVTAAPLPPRYLLGGHRPVLLFTFVPYAPRPCSEFFRRLLQGAQSAPLWWAPTTFHLGHHLGAGAISAPQVFHHHVLSVLQWRRDATGGALDDLAPRCMGTTGMIVRIENGHPGVPGYGGCCGYCYHCCASCRHAPRPLAGSSDANVSVHGLDTDAISDHLPQNAGDAALLVASLSVVVSPRVSSQLLRRTHLYHLLAFSSLRHA